MSGKSNLFLGQWSNQYTRHFMLTGIMVLVLGFLSLFLLQASLPCVDSDGCFKDHCKLEMFHDDYKPMLRVANN